MLLPTESRHSTRLLPQNLSGPLRRPLARWLLLGLGGVFWGWLGGALAAAQTSLYSGAAEPATPAVVYGQGVRETEWQTPEAEQLGFHLPPGFEIQPFAAEPQITKPLNMAWDGKGRLWVTNTVEYPHPAEEGRPPRDTIQILEDTDGDGRADRVKTFADQLNIPMGLLPVSDGVLCFSIPFLWHLRDTDGDDVVDERIRLLGPFDTSRDTHGMINALRRGRDGWIYACHGFNNQSKVTATDGSSVHLISGNTFRFKEDGSRIEQYTQGQVNPFGMTEDAFGNWITADCHSVPLTLLLRGGSYPSFGRPHDGLGFAPSMMRHLHGSTAISGVTCYLDDHFPPAYRELMFSGNVMTSRINCNRIRWRGSTPEAEELPDFLTSDDPWFRPVDIQLGPDGALYVADFYNKIIGHYEVPLNHPGRDRESGRIWRITYSGDQPHEPLHSYTTDPWTSLSAPNPTRRRAAIEHWVAADRSPAAHFEAQLRQMPDPDWMLAYLEVLHRRGELGDGAIEGLSRVEFSNAQAVHLFRMAAGWPERWRSRLLPRARATTLRLEESHPQVGKAAVEFLGESGGTEDVERLLLLVEQFSETDPVLSHAARIAIRDLLRNDDVLGQVLTRFSSSASGSQWPSALVEILPGVGSSVAAYALLGYVQEMEMPEPALLNTTIRLLVECSQPDPKSSTSSGEPTQGARRAVSSILALLDRLDEDSLTRADRVGQLSDRFQALHGRLPGELKAYGQQLVTKELLPVLAAEPISLKWIDPHGERWYKQERPRKDAQPGQFWSSHTRGEAYTGTLRSEAFVCPNEFRFWIAGHNGKPQTDDLKENLIRLVDDATGGVLQTAFPPRSDVATQVVWACEAWAGRRVRLEAIDGCAAKAFAWLAMGEFSESELNPSKADAYANALSKVLRSGCVPLASGGADPLRAVLERLSPRTQASLLADWMYGNRQSFLATLIRQAILLGRTDLVKFDWVTQPDPEATYAVARELCLTATSNEQRALARALLTNVQGCLLAAELLQRGVLGESALTGIAVALPEAIPADVAANLTRVLNSAADREARPVDVQRRVRQLRWSDADAAAGRQVFEQHCATCHQFRGAGKLVGPQLDGAVVRGVDRLSEDILDPNHNVDQAFRLSTVLLDDDTIVMGLLTEQNGGSVTLTSQDGKVTQYSSRQIVERKLSAKSLMPSNFDELLNDQQLASLLLFLGKAKPQ